MCPVSGLSVFIGGSEAHIFFDFKHCSKERAVHRITTKNNLGHRKCFATGSENPGYFLQIPSLLVITIILTYFAD